LCIALLSLPDNTENIDVKNTRYLLIFAHPLKTGKSRPQTALKQAPALYQARHSEQSLFYRAIADHVETWLAIASSGQFYGQGDMHTPARYFEPMFYRLCFFL
jgi:hypothetical protein